MEAIKNLDICDANWAVLFSLKEWVKEVIVNNSINVLADNWDTLILRVKDLELKENEVFFKDLQMALKNDRNQIENKHWCPKALWNKMSRIKREKYNKWMDLLQIWEDLWYKVDWKICDEKIIAHNALILLQKIL